MFDRIKKWFRKDKETEEPVVEESKDIRKKFMETLKDEEYNFLFENEQKMNALLDVIGYMKDSTDYLVVSTKEKEPKPENVVLYSLYDSPNLDFMNIVIYLLKYQVINMIGKDEYDKNIAYWDEDIALVYKEIDYQMINAQLSKLELEYYKMINSPNGCKAEEGVMMWNKILELRQYIENFN